MLGHDCSNGALSWILYCLSWDHLLLSGLRKYLIHFFTNIYKFNCSDAALYTLYYLSSRSCDQFNMLYSYLFITTICWLCYLFPWNIFMGIHASMLFFPRFSAKLPCKKQSRWLLTNCASEKGQTKTKPTKKSCIRGRKFNRCDWFWISLS